MMQKMHERTQGIIAGIIVFLIALTFALWGVQNYLKSSSADSVVATVSGKKITQRSLQNQYEKLKRMYIARSGGDFSFNQTKQAELKKAALTQLINFTTVAESARKMDFYVSPTQLSAFVAEIPSFQVDGKFSPAKFQQFLQVMLYTETSFFDELKNSIISNQLEEGIASTEFVLPAEIDQTLKLYSQQRDFSYILLEPKLVAAEITITDAEIEKFYKEHQNLFLSKEKVSIEYVQLTSSQLAKSLHPSSEQLKQFYQENPQYFSSVKKVSGAKVTKSLPFNQVASSVKEKYIKQKLVQTFADTSDKLTDLTYTNSDSLKPAAAALGLEIKTTELFTDQPLKTGFLSNPKIVKTAFSESVLKQGYNSNLIELEAGNVVVLRVKDHIPEKVLPLATVKNNIVKKLQEQKSKEKVANIAKQLVLLLQSGKTPNDLISKYRLNWHSLSKVSRSEKSINPKILEAAFSLSGPTSGEVRLKAVDLDRNGYAIVKLIAIHPGIPHEVKSEERNGVERMFKILQGRFYYMLWTDEMMNKSKVKIEDTNGASNTETIDLSDAD